MARCGIVVLSFLLACGLIQCEQRGYSNDYYGASDAPTDGGRYASYPSSYKCIESNEQYDCIFHNVFTGNLSRDVNFGDSWRKNNQSKLAFKNSTLRMLPRSLVSSFPEVEVLNLEGLQLHGIEPGALERGAKITKLYLSHNFIASLDADVFRNLISLEDLLMERNTLSSLPVGLFLYSPNLKVLSLANNNLWRVEDGTFQSNAALEWIDVSSNRLTHFDLSSIQNLYRANVTFNLLRKLSIPANIGVIDASNNEISEVVGAAKQLNVLLLSHNNLSTTGWLRDFTALEELDLSHNHIEDIASPDFRYLGNLTTMRLNHNRLFTFDLQKAQLPSLKLLDLSHNNLLFVERNQKQFELLNELYLAHNSIVRLMLGAGHNLTNLGLSYNDWDCKNLEELFSSITQTTVTDAGSEAHCYKGYNQVRGFCCKATDMPFLDRLIHYIAELSITEKGIRASGRCSGEELQTFAKTITNEIEQSSMDVSTAELTNTIYQLRKEVQRLEQQKTEEKTFLQSVIQKVEELLRKYRIPKVGLVFVSTNLKNVFDHLQQRDEFKRNETISRDHQTASKLMGKESLLRENDLLQATIENKKERNRALKSEIGKKTNAVKKLEAQKNRNAPSRHITK